MQKTFQMYLNMSSTCFDGPRGRKIGFGSHGPQNKVETLRTKFSKPKCELFYCRFWAYWGAQTPNQLVPTSLALFLACFWTLERLRRARGPILAPLERLPHSVRANSGRSPWMSESTWRSPRSADFSTTTETHYFHSKITIRQIDSRTVLVHPWHAYVPVNVSQTKS